MGASTLPNLLAGENWLLLLLRSKRRASLRGKKPRKITTPNKQTKQKTKKQKKSKQTNKQIKTNKPRSTLSNLTVPAALIPSTAPPRWPSGKASTSTAEDPGFESRLRRDFFGVESYQWLKHWHSSTVATLPGAWRYRVSTGTGRPGVSIL